MDTDMRQIIDHANALEKQLAEAEAELRAKRWERAHTTLLAFENREGDVEEYEEALDDLIEHGDIEEPD